jgi:hypothetical protein
VSRISYDTFQLQCVYQESGGIIQQRRLEKDPACFAKYKASTGNGHNFLLASRDCTLQVFVDFNVVWAAKLPAVPVHVSVADFGSQKGLIVTVDDSGKLSLGYLGTKPPLSAVVSTSRDVDYDKVDEEHRTLLQVTSANCNKATLIRIEGQYIVVFAILLLVYLCYLTWDVCVYVL